MATPQLSPGVLTREVDLTVGRADNVLDNIGGIAGPFEIGPVNDPINITTEQQLISNFGKPRSEENHYEYWMSASSYLSYGGTLNVIRTDGENLRNCNVGVGQSGLTNLKIKNFDDYNANYADSASNFYYAAKNPGTWSDGLKVCYIDDFADQVIGIATTSINNDLGTGVFGAHPINAQVGFAVTVDISGKVIPGAGTTSVFQGYLKGLIVQAINAPETGESAIVVKIHSRVSTGGTQPGRHYRVDYAQGSEFASFLANQRINIVNNLGEIASAVDSIGEVTLLGSTSILSEVGNTYTNVSSASGIGTGATFDVTRNNETGAVSTVIVNNAGVGYTVGTVTLPGSEVGGYDLSFGAVASTGISVGAAVSTAANGSFFGVSGVGTDGGTGVTFNIFRNNVGGIGTVTLVNPGQNFSVGEEITVLGNLIGGVAPNDNLVLTTDAIRDDKITVGITTTDQLISRVQVGGVLDWYNKQTLGLDNSRIPWSSIAPKPGTSNYAKERGGENDEMHVVIVDDSGSLTGIQGNILEKHLFMSKARDTVSTVSSPEKIWYKNYLANFSEYIYAGQNQGIGFDGFHNTFPVTPGFSDSGDIVIYTGSDPVTNFNKLSSNFGSWDRDAKDSVFSSIGAVTYKLENGSDYTEQSNLKSSLGDLIESYELFANKVDVDVDFLLMGPGLESLSETQAKANSLINLADSRKDCIAVISPHRSSVVNVTNIATQTSNIIQFFSPLQSSSYAVFDSGYKYTYDRFNNLFRYIPCNPDVAGLMARTNLIAYPWFSPAGQQRGIIKNAIKLAYNPDKAQRDLLYSSRINPIISQSGLGVLLFGDKTALGFASAFDRINVRRLFLTVEQALERAAESQLFEFNDQVTRANFVNIVEPYLRDVQAKRGIYDFLVICDETNNTPDVIDNNEFRADIFLKPAKSINYVTLTFVATRTGISFEEVAGRV
jgi:hypothetical protein